MKRRRRVRVIHPAEARARELGLELGSDATQAEAYLAGVDCAERGPQPENCHYRYFASPELAREWERGRASRAAA